MEEEERLWRTVCKLKDQVEHLKNKNKIKIKKEKSKIQHRQKKTW